MIRTDRHHNAGPLRQGVAAPMAALLVVALAGMVGGACSIEPAEDAGIEPRDGALPLKQPLAGTRVVAPIGGAHCEINVEGSGTLDMEEDYLPHVIQCENGGANLEALKAQAIAARSVAYYEMETSGSICDSQGCQVYSCGNNPEPIHYQAVHETSGIYLMYNETLTYGFYVAGDSDTAPPACVGVSGSTEGWVTYNEGLTGTDVEQTALGFIHDPSDFGYGQNRGCMSQWGARCLENNNGYDYLDILRFYYGDDIELIQAEGACVMELPGEGSDSSGEPPDPTTDGGEVDTGNETDTNGGGDDDPDPDSGGGSGDDLPGGTAGTPGDDGGGTTGVDTVDPGLPGTFGESEDGGGCGCRADAGRGQSGAWWLLGGLWLWNRRRRRPTSSAR